MAVSLQWARFLACLLLADLTQVFLLMFKLSYRPLLNNGKLDFRARVGAGKTLWEIAGTVSPRVESLVTPLLESPPPLSLNNPDTSSLSSLEYRSSSAATL